MPWDKALHKFKTGDLHSGSKTGPKVTDRKQAVAIMLNEKRKAAGKHDYASDTEPVKALKKAGKKS